MMFVGTGNKESLRKGVTPLSKDRSPVVVEERMKPGQWLGPMRCVSFSALVAG